MKKISFLLVALMLASVTSVNFLMAQTKAESSDKDDVSQSLCCHGKGVYNLPDLTDDQKKKIEDLQLAHLKEVNQTRALLKEKQAHLRTLQVADKPDNNAINKTIDEITSIKNDLMKKHEAHRQAVRALLKKKKKVVFDAKGCCSHGKGNCCGNCKGNCAGKCKGYGAKGNHEGCHHEPVKGKGCCHK